jgi:SAM-dependent methyltransferase
LTPRWGRAYDVGLVPVSIDEDVWGRVANDYLVGLPARHRFRRDDDRVFDNLAPQAYFSEVAHRPPFERRLWPAIQSPVLDVGCGPGSWSLHAQREGLEVIGLESSPGACAVARQRGVADVREGSWEELDAILDPQERGFGSVLLLGHNLGIGGTRERLVELLLSCHRVTRPMATILASSGNTMLTEKVDLDYWNRNEAEGRYRGEIRMRMEYQQYVGLEFTWMYISLADLEVDARRAGWRVEKVVDDPSGAYGVVLRRIDG